MWEQPVRGMEELPAGPIKAAGRSETKGVRMQVLIERSNVGSDVRCEVCGQGFLVYWDWASRQARIAARELVTTALRGQHEDTTTGHHVHPEERFAVPERRMRARVAGMMVPDRMSEGVGV